eukprot:3850654-Pleurochrysis_carterae.AAC.1
MGRREVVKRSGDEEVERGYSKQRQCRREEAEEMPEEEQTGRPGQAGSRGTMWKKQMDLCMAMRSSRFHRDRTRPLAVMASCARLRAHPHARTRADACCAHAHAQPRHERVRKGTSTHASARARTHLLQSLLHSSPPHPPIPAQHT